MNAQPLLQQNRSFGGVQNCDGYVLTCAHTVVIVFESLSVLHPHHKLHYFKMAGWENSWIKMACTIVREEFDQTYAFMDVEHNNKPTEEREHPDTLFDLTEVLT